MELHNEVRDLLNLTEDVEAGLAELSAYYTQARYANAGLRRPSTEIGKEQARKALKVSEGILNAVARVLT